MFSNIYREGLLDKKEEGKKQNNIVVF